MKCPFLAILVGSACVCLTMMSMCSSPESMDLSGNFFIPLWPSPDSSLACSSSTGTRSHKRKWCASNYLKGTTRAPFKSCTLEKTLSHLAPSTATVYSIADMDRSLISVFTCPHYLGSCFSSCWHAWSFAKQLSPPTFCTQQGQDQTASLSEGEKQVDS